MSAVAPMPPPPSRAVDIALIVAVLAGAALTTFGWLSVDREDWVVADHLTYVLGVWPLAALLVFAARLTPLAAGVAVASLACAACGTLGPLLVVGAISWSCDTLGRSLLRRWPGATALETTLLGLAVHCTAVSLLVQLPINYPGTYAGLLALPLVCDRSAARRSLQDGWRQLREPGVGDWRSRLVGATTISVVVVNVLVAMLPEVGYDALVTHLLLPAHVEHAHGFDFDVDRNVWAVMPILADWLYTSCHMLGGETAARFGNLGCLLLLATLIRTLALWAGADRLGAGVAALVFLSSPLMLTESSSLFVDPLWACLAVGGAAATLRVVARSEGTIAEPRHLVVAGALLGGALAAKAVTFTVLPILALLLLLGWRRWLRRDRIGVLLTGLLAFVAIGAVPYVRAWLLTGNPVFPFFNAVFQSPHYPPENFTPPPQFAVGVSWRTLFDITFDAERHLESRPGGGGFQWLLVVVPVALVALLRRHRRSLVLLGVAAAITWMTFRQTAYLRYVLPSIALATAAIGPALGRGAALGVGRAGRSVLAIAAIAAVALDLTYYASAVFTARLRLRAAFSEAARDAYITAQRPLRRAVQVVNQLDQQHRPVAFFCQPFGAGLQATGIWTNWYNPVFSTAVLKATSAAQMGRLIARERVDYVLLRASWRDERLRAMVREVTDEVLLVADVSVRRLRDEYRFCDELLQAPRFEQLEHWQITTGAVVEPGRGALVTAASPATQRVAVQPGREYRFGVEVRRGQADTAAMARLQVGWLDADGQHLASSLQVVTCEAAAQLFSMDLVAPRGSAYATVFATAHGEAPVLFESLSFRN